MDSPIQFIHFIEANFILFLCQLFSIFIILKLIVDKKSASNILAWVLGILFIPYIAIPFFFLFQRKNRRSLWQKSDMDINTKCSEQTTPQQCRKLNLPEPVISVFSSLGLNTLTSNNTFDMYTNGVDSYNSFTEALNSAIISIYIQTYVFKNDETSKNIISILEKKASEGIDVKVLIDSLGSFYVYRHNKRIFKNLRVLGATVVFFMPVLSNPFRNYINFRNHRKIYLIDQSIAFSGGMNIGNEYMGPHEDKTMWEDLLFKISGEAVNHFTSVFVSDWRFATKEEIDITTICSVSHNTNYMEVIPSGPDMQDQLYVGILTSINSAKEKLWIITPYLVPSQELLQSIMIAKYRGVDVKIITPKKSNHKIVDKARNSYSRELSKIGVDIHYTEHMLHAKAILIDDNLAMVGSVNLDNRSLFLNYEIATFLYSQESVAKLYSWADKILKETSKDQNHISNKPSSLFVESIVKVLTPLM